MSNEDGSLRVVFNGEIYNHAEIRRELEKSGRHRWKTDHSDTEVILHAFEEWGIACLDRFRGMFAIALWEAKARRLWLVRDRIGIKPLYYSMHHGRITFASEIKALLKDSEQRREVDEEAFFHFLSFITTPGPQTLFAGIKKLPPASWLCVNEDGSTREERYWDVWDHARPLNGASEAELAERVLAELRVAVRLRKVSDVPVGVFLSGGIDSSTNAALFSEGEASVVKTFTVGYRGEYQSYRNELSFARLMAGRIGADHHEILLGEQDLLDFLPEMIRLQDEPIADPVCVPLYYVSKLARSARGHRLPGGRGFRRTVLGILPMEAHAASATTRSPAGSSRAQAYGNAGPRSRRKTGRLSVRVASPRCRGAADLLGRRRLFFSARKNCLCSRRAWGSASPASAPGKWCGRCASDSRRRHGSRPICIGCPMRICPCACPNCC